MGRVIWELKVRGGAYDGWIAETEQTPQDVLILWRCRPKCGGHGTFHTDSTDLDLRTAEAYKRTEFDPVEHLAVYEQPDPVDGDGGETEEREAIGAGAGPGYGQDLWP